MRKLLVLASFNNTPFDEYVLQTEPGRLPDGWWREVFNSDAAIYGGDNVGNQGAELLVRGGRMTARIPARGVLVFQQL